MSPDRSFADDDRGWLPFALVGVVVLVGSVGLFVGLQPDRPAAEPATDVAVERVVGETQTELRAAVVDASDDAARDPVLAPANTSAGRVLDADSSFRDALRLRIYLRARERLDEVTASREDVTATASLPATPNASDLRGAIERVRVESVTENRTKLRVRVENVTVTASRGNETVVRQRMSPTVVVRTPVLAVHERVGRFEERLDAGLARPGLTRRLTGRLYGVVWARGYAQYGTGGAVVENVLANRHVELMTNGAILREQRHLFGRSDASGRRAMRRALLGVGTTDLLRGAGASGADVDAIFGDERSGPNVPVEIPSLDTATGGPRASDEMTVGVDGTADRALAHATSRERLSDVLESVYSAEVETIRDVDRTGGSLPPCYSIAPEGFWRLDSEGVAGDDPEVRGNRSAALSAPVGWHAFASFGRRVTQERTKICRWVHGNETTVTRASDTFRFDVEVALVGRHARSDYAPDREIETVHESGKGPFDGPNLASIEDRARARLIDRRGGRDRLAALAVREDRNITGKRTLRGPVPAGIRQRLRADLVRFSDRVANVSASVRRGRVGTFEANPAGELHRTLGGLVDPPATYDSVAEKARFAARGMYIERTRARLAARERRQERRGRNLDDAFDAVGVGSTDLLRDALGNRSGVERERDETRVDGLEIRSVEGAPPYLTVAEVGPEDVDSLPNGTRIRPLGARNVNLFASPHGHVADAVIGAGGPNETVGLRTAARTLWAARAAREVPTDNGTLEAVLQRESETLETEVEGELESARERLRRSLASMGVGETASDRRRIVADALQRWDGPGATALAVTNGSAAEAVAERAVVDDETNRTLVRAHLRSLLHRRATDGSTEIARQKVNDTSELVRRKVSDRVSDAGEKGTRKAGERIADRLDDRLTRSVNRVPAGLPLVPAGPAWWTTTNVWIVQVRGGYDRFAVRAGTGAAGSPGGALTYVRDGGAATVDYDGDGAAEVLGRAPRISFESRTAVAIAVPQGPQGVGDKDGTPDERSESWSDWEAAGADGEGEPSVPESWPDRRADEPTSSP
ncbi:DUF7286 family protein [Halorientalis halophila]|uniref:DUF7286 family protein n=1 Tax=Halorientalis halophila TaxID=3108499 RepID=UPI00300A5F2A